MGANTSTPSTDNIVSDLSKIARKQGLPKAAAAFRSKVLDLRSDCATDELSTLIPDAKARIMHIDALTQLSCAEFTSRVMIDFVGRYRKMSGNYIGRSALVYDPRITLACVDHARRIAAGEVACDHDGVQGRVAPSALGFAVSTATELLFCGPANRMGSPLCYHVLREWASQAGSAASLCAAATVGGCAVARCAETGLVSIVLIMGVPAPVMTQMH